MEGDPVVRQAHHERSPPLIPSLSRDKPLDFLAQGARRDDRSVTLRGQHIPDRGQHLIRYGRYSNKSRGMRKAAEKAETSSETTHLEKPTDESRDEDYRKVARRRWAALIKKVYEVDPLICPKCGGKMDIIAFIMEPDAIRKILEHIGENAPAERAPPNVRSPALVVPSPPAAVSGEWEYFPEEPIP